MKLEPDLVEAINALPERLRKYIHHIETDADPAGTLRENFQLREENALLRKECERLAATDQSDAADAKRFRWLLAGRGYFMEECELCGPWSDKDDTMEHDRARKAIDEAMRDEAPVIDHGPRSI
jgi:hypothetical protein